MNSQDIARLRMIAQQIARPACEHPADVVQWLGAVQAQDFLGALWAVGLRMPSATAHDVEQALADKAIVRTWPMRGTIHFVAPADVRWMLELLTPRVIPGINRRLAQMGLDEKIIDASANVVAKALQGGRQLERNALYKLMDAADIPTDNSRGLHILGRLAHDRLVCFGARAGKQPTFALLDEWAPEAKSLPRDEALAKLARRYFTGHGPATLQDFVWWSGLTVTDARAGLAAAAAQLASETVDGQEYYFAQNLPAAPAHSRAAFLLPPFDEFLVAYRDRSASLDKRHSQLVVPGGNGIFNPIVVIDGRVLGTWKRAFQKDSVAMSFSSFDAFSDEQAEAIQAAAERYGQFVGKRVSLSL